MPFESLFLLRCLPNPPIPTKHMLLFGCSECASKESNSGIVLGQRGTLSGRREIKKEEASATKMN